MMQLGMTGIDTFLGQSETVRHLSGKIWLRNAMRRDAHSMRKLLKVVCLQSKYWLFRKKGMKSR